MKRLYRATTQIQRSCRPDLYVDDRSPWFVTLLPGMQPVTTCSVSWVIATVVVTGSDACRVVGVLTPRGPGFRRLRIGLREKNEDHERFQSRAIKKALFIGPALSGRCREFSEVELLPM
jgi:hypothetical protein